MRESMSTRRRVLYALGSTGFQITDRIVVAISLYFYLPPGGRGLEPQIPTGVFAFGLTAYGAAMLIGRLFDMWADPIVGYASDRSRSPLGRRRAFLIYGIAPMVVLPVLLFWPPGYPGSSFNAYWLAVILSVYFVFFTIYVAPFLALIPEIASTEKERVRLAAIMAGVSFPILTVFGVAWGVGVDLGRGAGMSTIESVRWIVVIASVLAFVLCLGPILAVDEKRFAHTVPSTLPLKQSLLLTIRNRGFVHYLIAQLPFILGINMIGPALVYYATVVLGRSEGFAIYLGGAMILPTIIGFAIVHLLTRRLGSKRTMVLCVGLFSITLCSLWWLQPDAPGGPNDAGNLWLIFTVLAINGLPLAGFLVLPPVIIGQLTDWDQVHTGANRAAMYFGMQGFITKLPYGVSAAILAYLFQSFGASPEEPLGVLLVGPIAGGFCLLSTLLFLLYPERAVLEETRRRGISLPAETR
jgi:GPH family glycoside/pentoside/hexuronide:cation symporter